MLLNINFFAVAGTFCIRDFSFLSFADTSQYCVVLATTLSNPPSTNRHQRSQVKPSMTMLCCPPFLAIFITKLVLQRKRSGEVIHNHVVSVEHVRLSPSTNRNHNHVVSVEHVRLSPSTNRNQREKSGDASHDCVECPEIKTVPVSHLLSQRKELGDVSHDRVTMLCYQLF